MTTLWDTTGGEIVKALAADRRGAGAVTGGLVLTLVAVADERRAADAIVAARAAALAHPCRVLVVVRRQPDSPSSRLDAEIQVGGPMGPGEAVVMRMYGRLALHAESVVLPLLASDSPVVTWWYGDPPQLIAHDPLGVLADRRVTDVAAAPSPTEALRGRAADYYPGDTDLAWTRTTGWRGVLAAAFDTPVGRVHSAEVTAAASDPSAALLAGWLTGRLGVPVPVRPSRGRGVTEVAIEGADDGDGEQAVIRIARADGASAMLSRAGRPDRLLPLPSPETGDLLAEELQRLEPDEVYAEALSTATGVGLSRTGNAVRSHIWQDPVPAATGAATGAAS